MSPWPEVIRISASFLFLAFSSWKDYEKREVSNAVWLLFAPISLLLSLVDGFSRTDLSFLISLASSFVVVTGLSFALFYLDFFGGADAKALICLSFALPVPPALLRPYLDLVLPIFCLSVISNAVLMSSLLALGIAVYNLSRYVKVGKGFFEGLENESYHRRFLLFITGIRVDSSKIKDTCQFIPLETFSKESDGKITRHLHLFPRINREDGQDLAPLRGPLKEVKSGVWVTPSIPFLVFVTMGFITTLLLGDILIWLVFGLVS